MRIVEWGLNVKKGVYCSNRVTGLVWVLDWWPQMYSLILHGLQEWYADRDCWTLIIVICFFILTLGYWSLICLLTCSCQQTYRNVWTLCMPRTRGKRSEHCFWVILLAKFFHQTSTALSKSGQGLPAQVSLSVQMSEEKGQKKKSTNSRFLFNSSNTFSQKPLL